MKRTITTLTAAALLALYALVPVGATEHDEDEWEPVLEAERTFFKCDIDAVPARAALWNAAKPLVGAVPWTHVPPAGSVFDGEGCLNADIGTLVGPVSDEVSPLEFAGKAGVSTPTNLDNLTFIIYALSMGFPDASWPVEFSATVNGVEVVPPTEIDERPRDSNGGVTNHFEITVTNLGFLEEEDYGEHDIEFTFRFTDADRLTAWAWDTSEAASGVWFNNLPSAPHIVIDAQTGEPGDPSDPGDGPGGDLPGLPDDLPGLPDDLPGLPDELPGLPEGGPGLGAHIVATGVAQPMFLPSTAYHFEGEIAQFTNLDTAAHDVTCLQRINGRPICQSDPIGFGQTSDIQGTENLAPGSYDYYCALHPGMTGTLEVS